MIYTILSWIYITLLAYPFGLVLHKYLRRFITDKCSTEYLHFSITCISGLVLINFICSVICLFYPLSIISNLFLLGVSLLLALVFRKELAGSIRADVARLLKAKTITSLLFLLFLTIVAYLSYLPSSHHDDGLYYSTSIKWLEEYGTVKGLANLNVRIGYNSSWHILQANFSFSFLDAGLFNDLNGLLYLWILIYSLGGISHFLKGDHSFRNTLRVLFFIPLLTFHLGMSSGFAFYNANQVSSSSPDIVVCMMLWLIFVLFPANGSVKAGDVSLQRLLIIIYAGWLITIKLSAAPIVLIPLFYLTVWTIKQKSGIAIRMAAICFLVLLPWCIRNLLISGYVVFPFSAIDFFNPEWKLPLEHVYWHENAVRVYAINSESDLNQPFQMSLLQWFPSWFDERSFIQQVLLIISMICTIMYLITTIVQLAKRNFLFFSENFQQSVPLLVLFSGIVFWLVNAPDFRMGYGFLWPYCLFSIALFLRYFLEGHIRFIIFPLIIYMGYVAIVYYGRIWREIPRTVFTPPVPHRMPEKTGIRRLNDKEIIHLVFYDDTWNCPLPASNNNEFATIQPTLIGKDLPQGFKPGRTGK